MDYYGFYTGKIFDAYEYLGAHPDETGTVFCTFAPAASSIQVIGEWNGWEGSPMEKIHDGNFWECRIPEALPGMMYKFKITGPDGSVVDHCDPYGFQMELRPGGASVITAPSAFSFTDQKWMRSRNPRKEEPLNIYELHAGSWRCREGEAPDCWYTYEELADLLIPWLLENHYNCLEFLPLSEHPADISWGYQNTGFFSPTSRYGTPDGLRALVNACHKNGISVLLDFVPVHFALDSYGLSRYDGTSLYEYPHQDVGVSEWGSCNFMHSRGEVRSFLQSAAWYWLKEFHFDGLRMDAISNMIYWQGDPARGVNNAAVQFLQNLNSGLKERNPGVILCAEDSTSFPGVTKPVAEGGLGFDYKWDMGWMHDTLSYFQSAPEYRTRDYHRLTFSMQYFYDETFLLPLSHDEVVYGKATILQKMNGDYEKKFPQARAFYLYMYAHPGKKLNFMGNEIGQFREWDERRQQDWDLLRYPLHDAFLHFMRELNRIYLNCPALSAGDYSREGFAWLDCQSEEDCIYAFLRRGKGQTLIALFHLSDAEDVSYSLTLPGISRLRLLLASDADTWGGPLHQIPEHPEEEENCFHFRLSAFSGRLYLVEK